MKTLTTLALAILITLPLAATPKQSTKIQTETKADIHITAKGMVCSFCAQGLKKSFNKINAVESTKVDLKNHSIKLYLKEGQTLKDKKIKKIIKEAGYQTKKIQRQ